MDEKEKQQQDKEVIADRKEVAARITRTLQTPLREFK